jgi:hypothetical protein
MTTRKDCLGSHAIFKREIALLNPGGVYIVTAKPTNRLAVTKLQQLMIVENTSQRTLFALIAREVNTEPQTAKVILHATNANGSIIRQYVINAVILL